MTNTRNCVLFHIKMLSFQSSGYKRQKLLSVQGVGYLSHSLRSARVGCQKKSPQAVQVGWKIRSQAPGARPGGSFVKVELAIRNGCRIVFFLPQVLEFFLSFYMVFATFWCLKRSCGSLEGSLGFHVGFHVRFH